MSSYNNIANIKAGNGVKIDQKYNGFQRFLEKAIGKSPPETDPTKEL